MELEFNYPLKTTIQFSALNCRRYVTILLLGILVFQALQEIGRSHTMEIQMKLQ